MFAEDFFEFFKVEFEQVGYPEEKGNKNKIVAQILKNSGNVMFWC